MNKLQYQEYINSPHWVALKKQFESHNTKCAACGTTKDLDIHHLSYERVTCEKEEDLVRLCREDHYACHYLYKTLVNDFYTGQLPFKPTLTEVTDSLLKNSTLFTLAWKGWVEANMKANGGWQRRNNFHQNRPGTHF